MVDQRGRRIIASLDGYKTWEELVKAFLLLMNGPIGPYVRMVKLNDALDRFGGASAFERLWNDAGVNSDVGAFADLKVTEDMDNGLLAMADLKLEDVVFTNLNRIAPYAEFQRNAVVTVHMSCSLATWQQVPVNFPYLQTALMGVPTDIDPVECALRNDGRTPWEATDKQLEFICRPWTDAQNNEQPARAPQPPCIIAGEDIIIPVLKKYPGIKPITPGIRDDWMKDKGDQKRTVGIYEALSRGIYGAVMATQLLKGYKCKDDPTQSISPEESQERTAAEIERWVADTAA